MASLRILAAALALLAATGCTDKLVGFRAEFASNTVAVHAGPPSGNRLTFRVQKRITDLQKRTVYLRPHRAMLHLTGYLPLTPDGVDDAGEVFEVRVTLPQDLVKLATGGPPNAVQVRGELYVPTETGVMSFTGVELREPSSMRTIGVSLAAVHTGPMTSAANAIGEFLRGLYSAR